MAPRNGQSGQTNDPNSPWYIHPHHTVDSSQQLQQQADQQAQQDVNNSLGNVPVVNTFDPLVSGVVGQQNYQSALGNQANELRQGVDTRHSPTIAPTNYLSFSHPQLHTMVTQQVDPGQAGHIGSSWTSIGNTMVRFQDDVAGAISNSETQWQGTAGDSARTFMAQMANWIGTAGQGAQLAGTQAARQSDAVANAKAMMPEPVNFDWNTAMNQLKASNPDPLSYLTQYSADAGMYAAQQGAHFAAAQVVRNYDQTLGQSNVMPAFSRPPVFGTGNTTGQPPKPNPIQPRPGQPGQPTPPPGGNPTNPTNPTQNPGPPAQGQPPTQGQPPGSQSPTGLGTGTPPGTGTPNLPNLPTGTPTTTSASSAMPNPPTDLGTGGSGLPGGLSGLTGGGLPGGQGGGTGLGGLTGFGGGVGAGGLGAGGLGAGGLGSGRFGGAGSGSASGAAASRSGAGVAADEEAAGLGRGTSRGAAGANGAGGPMGGGRGGKKEDDGEHRRASYLIEADPEGVFGTDEMTAPAVIGEDEYE